MAEGGFDLDMEDIGGAGRRPPPDYGRNEARQQFENPVFDNDATEYNTTVNTGATNLATDTAFGTPELAPTVTPELMARDLEIKQDVDSLEKALEGTGWSFTETGLNKLAGTRRITSAPEGGLDLVVYKSDYKFTPAQLDRLHHSTKKRDLAYIELTKPNGKFYAKSTLEKNFGTGFIRELEGYLETPDENIQLRPMPSMDDQPSIAQPQPAATPETSFIENVVDEPNSIDRIIDATDNDLKEVGFSDHALREIRGLKQAGDNLAAVKQEKDRQIEELEKTVTYLNKMLTEATEENIDIRHDLMKEIEGLDDQIIREKHKVWQINMERESQIRRVKNIITDVLKQPDSKIPLKDRVKLLFKVEGLTLAAIVTAVIMTFTTIGLAISNSMKGAPSPTPGPGPGPGPSPDPSIADRVREGLKQLARWLAELAKKSAAALPGIIGAIVSFLIKTIGAAVGFLAEHVIILLIAVVSSIVYGLVNGVKWAKKSH